MIKSVWFGQVKKGRTDQRGEKDDFKKEFKVSNYFHYHATGSYYVYRKRDYQRYHRENAF